MFKKPSNIPVWWLPQPGTQTYAAVCPVQEILMGGNRGGGKTQTAIGRQCRGAAKWGPKWNGLMFRKKYKQLAGLRRDFDDLIRNGMPAERVGGDRETNYIRFNTGATITLASIPDLKSADDYQGGGFTEISIEEASQYAFIAELVDRLHGALRSGSGVPSSIFMTGNPGGPGAAQLKAMFMIKPDGTPRKPRKSFMVDGVSRVFIPSDLRDNKILMANDPGYEVRMAAIKDPVLRAAWYEGSWEYVIGQAFTLHPRNIIDPIWPIPPHVPILMSFDWGYGAPFSVGWYWVDSENRLYKFAEWYGCVSVNQPNKGLRLTDKEIARGILERERQMGISDRRITRFAGHDCANKKPNYTTGVPGPSTVEEFLTVAADPSVRASYGDVDLTLITRKPDKLDKMKQFRERLYVPEDPKVAPMLLVYNTCTHFRRVIPSLALDEINQEQLENGQEDHCLAGETEVITDNGVEPIKNLVGKSGRILTVEGYWSKFSDCKLTQKSVHTIKVNFFNDRSIICTPDHKFLTIHGKWVEAKDLTNEDCYVSISRNKNIEEVLTCEWKSLVPQFKNLTELGIGYVDITFNEKVNDFIEKYGNIIMDRFQKENMSTISMITEAITRLRILTYGGVQSINPTMVRRTTIPIGLRHNILEQQSGTAAKRDENGIENTTMSTAILSYMLMYLKYVNNVNTVFKENRDPGFVVNYVPSVLGGRKVGNRKYAWYVDPSLWALNRFGLVQNLVQQHSHGKSVKVRSVELCGYQDVYCLNAEYTHAFAVNGGIVVHNCYDETALICMCRPLGLNHHELEKIRVAEERKKLPKLDSASAAATREFEELCRQMEHDYDYETDYHRGISIN